MVRALRHHLTASVVKYGHSILRQTGFLEGQEVPNPEIVSNGKLYPSLIEDKCVIHHLGLDLLLASCVYFMMIFDGMVPKYGLKVFGIEATIIVTDKLEEYEGERENFDHGVLDALSWK
jgi:hypothetical protein